MPADTITILTAARAAAGRYRASATGSAYRADHEAIAAGLAEVDRLSARVAELEPFLNFHRGKVEGLNARIAELERERARDVAGIVGWLRSDAPVRRWNEGIGGSMLDLAADAIERGDWHDGVPEGGST